MEIARIAGIQYGVVAWRQLIAAGLGRGAIATRIAAGRLHPLHVGVYAVGHTVVPREGRWLGAVLAFEEGAVLSHRSAAELWGLVNKTDLPPHVTSAQRTLRGRPRIHLHRVRALDPELVTSVARIPATGVPRTLLDLAGVRHPTLLRRAWEGAQRLGLLDVSAVALLCERSPGRRLGPLRDLIAEATDAPDTASELESRFADLLRANPDLPAPAWNVVLEGYVVDCAWMARRVVVELDGHRFHSGHQAFEADRERDVRLAVAGYTVVRVTWRRLARDPGGVASDLRRLLARA